MGVEQHNHGTRCYVTLLMLRPTNKQQSAALQFILMWFLAVVEDVFKRDIVLTLLRIAMQKKIIICKTNNDDVRLLTDKQEFSE